MDLSWISDNWGFLVVAVPIVYQHVTQRSKVNAQQLEDMEKAHSEEIGTANDQVAELRSRVDVLEALRQEMPTHGDLKELHGRVTDVGKEIEKLKGTVEGGNRIQNNILQVLLEKGTGE
ncbi:MAG: DUF2730 family protein [Holophagales bacterium]|nr:DUF2730 family protein [Holophagales bacterium]MYC11918.1 DUF2730 family protein [Holophagales bacterium]